MFTNKFVNSVRLCSFVFSSPNFCLAGVFVNRDCSRTVRERLFAKAQFANARPPIRSSQSLTHLTRCTLKGRGECRTGRDTSRTSLPKARCPSNEPTLPAPSLLVPAHGVGAAARAGQKQSLRLRPLAAHGIVLTRPARRPQRRVLLRARSQLRQPRGNGRQHCSATRRSRCWSSCA